MKQLADEAPEELSTKVANLAIVGKDAAGRGAEKAKQMAQSVGADEARLGERREGLCEIAAEAG